MFANPSQVLCTHSHIPTWEHVKGSCGTSVVLPKRGTQSWFLVGGSCIRHTGHACVSLIRCSSQACAVWNCQVASSRLTIGTGWVRDIVCLDQPPGVRTCTSQGRRPRARAESSMGTASPIIRSSCLVCDSSGRECCTGTSPLPTRRLVGFGRVDQCLPLPLFAAR